MTTIIKNPRVTEKASNANEQNVYTFDIAKSANKTEIKKAVFTLYKVLPVRINVLSVPRKTIIMGSIMAVRFSTAWLTSSS